MISLLENLKLEAEISESELDCFIEGRRFTAKTGDEILCWAGELKPEVLESWELEIPVAALEMDIDKLYEMTLRD
jgi:phenylalanyl-tRNA synthetase beta subunit